MEFERVETQAWLYGDGTVLIFWWIVAFQICIPQVFFFFLPFHGFTDSLNINYEIPSIDVPYPKTYIIGLLGGLFLTWRGTR